MFGQLENERIDDIFDSMFHWYQENKRDLPWRQNPDFYSVWLSEIMAQQTKMNTLIPYYLRFKKLFPTIHEVAMAKEEEILKAWEGLGYYQRAKNLHKTAKILDSILDLPSEKAELLLLPGIGPYTAGAILSMVYKKPYPAVDGNLLRVFARLENYHEDVTKQKTRNNLENVLLPHMDARAGEINQSFMELGSLICIPQTPRCQVCPIAIHCQGFAENTMDSLPYRGKIIEKKVIEKTIFVIQNHTHEFLMRERTERLLEGMWEFYSTDSWIEEKDITTFLAPHNLDITTLSYIGEKKHIFTHLIWDMKGYLITVKDSPIIPSFSYTSLESFAVNPIPSALRFFSDYLINQ